MPFICVALCTASQGVLVPRIPRLTIPELALRSLKSLHGTAQVLRQLRQRRAIEDLLSPGSFELLGHEALPGCLDLFLGISVSRSPVLDERCFVELILCKLLEESLPIRITHLNMIHAPRHGFATRELSPHHIVLTQRDVVWNIRAVRRIECFLGLEHRHQRDVAVVVGFIAPGTHIVQQMRWGVETIAFLNGSVAPLRFGKLGPAGQVNTLAIDGGVIRAARFSFGRSPVVVIPHRNLRCFGLQVPHDPLFLSCKDTHNLVVHVVVNGRCSHHLGRHAQIPEVVLIQLRHPRLALDMSTWRPLATVHEARDFPLLAHVIWHL
mmetsp:Transcript_12167/g.26369  ORF Transcript_12167/g.26369 Transcript_12167/m.26369 type:complete len:323 (-) Transcript_12167:76-1044(-)